MSDIEQEVDFSDFNTKPTPPSNKPNKDGVVIIDETGGDEEASLKRTMIYIIVIIALVAGIYVEWKYFYAVPQGPPEDALIDLSKVKDPAPPPVNSPGPSIIESTR